VRFWSRTPAEAVGEWHAAGLVHVHLDGGRLISDFLAAGLVDDLTLTVVPVLLGSGSRLFHEVPVLTSLRLESSRSYPNGVVQQRYRRTWHWAHAQPRSGSASTGSSRAPRPCGRSRSAVERMGESGPTWQDTRSTSASGRCARGRRRGRPPPRRTRVPGGARRPAAATGSTGLAGPSGSVMRR
jgi:hypothetical protein